MVTAIAAGLPQTVRRAWVPMKVEALAVLTGRTPRIPMFMARSMHMTPSTDRMMALGITRPGCFTSSPM
jgi:hypothetical protein